MKQSKHREELVKTVQPYQDRITRLEADNAVLQKEIKKAKAEIDGTKFLMAIGTESGEKLLEQNEKLREYTQHKKESCELFPKNWGSDAGTDWQPTCTCGLEELNG